MKTLHLFSVALMLVMLSACSHQEDKKSLIANASADMSIDGMVCAMGCAKAIEKELSTKNGIVAISVNFEENTAHVEFDKDVISETDIEKEIESLNEGQYKVEKIEAKSKKVEEVKGGGDNKISVRDGGFSFPQLLTYFMNNL